MNKLITTDLGGYPFVLDDLRFIDESVREVLTAQFERFINSSDPNDKGFLISNLIKQGHPFLYAPGGGYAGQNMPESFVYISGEIYYLPAGTIPAGTNTSVSCFVEPDISFTGTTPGSKVLESGTPVETYQIRRAKYTLTPTTTDNIRLTNTGTMHPDNLSIGYDFEFNSDAFLIQRELIALGIDSLQMSDNTLLQLVTNLITTTNNINSSLNPVLNDNWISVPMATLMRTTNPVFFRSSNWDPTSTTFTPVPTDCSIDQVNSFLKIKRIGKTVFLNIELKNLITPGYPTAYIHGFFIDLNNLGITDFTGGTVQNFNGILKGGSSLASACSGDIEVIESNGNLASGKNGIFFRLRNGMSKNFAQWNINYYHQVTTAGAYSNVIRTILFPDFDIYPTSSNWDIKGTLIFEMY